MKKRLYFVALIVALLVVVFTVQSFGQFQSRGVRVGGGVGFLIGSTEKDDDDISEAAQIFLRHNIIDHFDGDLSGTYGGIKATDYQADLWYGEYKILYKPWASKRVEPYIGAGLGYGYYYAHPTFRSPLNSKDEYFPYIPVTIGLEWALTEGFYFDLSGSYSYSFTDRMVTNKRTSSEGSDNPNDAWFGVFARLSVTLFGGDGDADKDGLLKSEEKRLGTNPNNFDTDGDGLSDGDEVRKYRTNPLKGDTDGDGLSDADEVLKYKTDPLKADTDGDGLSDGDEISLTKTDPLKADTDGDGYNDGEEVKNKTNPLDPNDPKKPKPIAFKAEVGKAIVLEGVVFRTGSAVITDVSDAILSNAKKTLEDNPDIHVQIQGFTDDVGSERTNQRLSQKRADAVRVWLIRNGIAPSRITAKGFGEKNPIGDNSTPEGRQKNRRIEFFRTK